jgi:hypothetical protein
MAAHSNLELRRAAGGGALAGLLSGLVLAVVLVMINVSSGGSLWTPLKFAGAPLLGERAMMPGFDAVGVLVGVGTHLAVSAFWGLTFGVVFFGGSRGLTLLAGLAWGFVVWLVMHFGVMPLVGLGAAARQSPYGIAILEHLLFGVVLAVAFLPFQRSLPGHFGAAPRPSL